MKKIFAFTFILLSLVLIACSGGDDNGPETDNPNAVANLQPLGSSARDFLSDENFTSLVIDLVFIEGFRPTNEAVANLVNFIEERTFKPEGVRVEFTEIPSTGDDAFSIQEIADIESERRTLFNNGTELALFVFFADANSENSTENSVVIGAAYRNTSLVIYQSTVLQLANNGQGITQTTIESAVLNHEIAHLFGLVDLGTPLQSDHLDEANGNHCNVPNCLMQFQIDFGFGMQMMAGNVIPQLDPLCIADLRANGGR